VRREIKDMERLISQKEATEIKEMKERNKHSCPHYVEYLEIKIHEEYEKRDNDGAVNSNRN